MRLSTLIRLPKSVSNVSPQVCTTRTTQDEGNKMRRCKPSFINVAQIACVLLTLGMCRCQVLVARST
jgi:hypothetical protein